MTAIPEDLSIPAFLRRQRTPETDAAALRLIEQMKNQFRQPRKLRRRHLTDEQATEQRIKDEADRRWRSWVPSKESLHRPRLSTFERLVRAEFKAKVARRDAMSEATTTEETVVGKTKTKSSKARTAVKGKTLAKAPERAPVGTPGGVRPGSKLEAIVQLLTRDGGCTTADVLKATGWPSVSMPQQAKAAGLTLRKEKDGGVTRYRAA